MRLLSLVLLALGLVSCDVGEGRKGGDGKWEALREQVGPRLVSVEPPLDQCRQNPDGKPCAEVLEKMNNPFFLQSQPGITESAGWLDAWAPAFGPYAVVAESVDDIVAAVNFARENGMRLAVKGAGHSYQGRSCAADSLLLWTRKMNHVSLHDAFVPQGAPEGTTPVHAVSAGAGTIWGEAYDAVTTRGGRYVQGGGCPTVGVAGGFLQSGGFGSYSKYYGTAAASWLEAEVVLASGEVLIANDYQNSDLFWALKGGGGGTYGVVARVTLQTHELPEFFGLVAGKIQAKSDEAYRELLTQIARLSRQHLLNPNWGEKVILTPSREVELSMRSAGLDEQQINEVWGPFFEWVKARPDVYTATFNTIVTPAQDMWNYHYWNRIRPEKVRRNEIDDNDLYFWTSGSKEAAAYWYSMGSRWLPQSLFTEEREKELVNMLFDASQKWWFELNYNKGLAEVTEEVRERELKTSLNPIARDASMLLLTGAMAKNVFPNVPGHKPDDAEGRAMRKKVDQALAIVTAATPESGAFFTQSDYFQKDWQKAYWGENYPRLLEVKKKYDPTCFFRVHHGVNSECQD